jgi:hypothetical protein
LICGWAEIIYSRISHIKKGLTFLEIVDVHQGGIDGTFQEFEAEIKDFRTRGRAVGGIPKRSCRCIRSCGKRRADTGGRTPGGRGEDALYMFKLLEC